MISQYRNLYNSSSKLFGASLTYYIHNILKNNSDVVLVCIN